MNAEARCPDSWHTPRTDGSKLTQPCPQPARRLAFGTRFPSEELSWRPSGDASSTVKRLRTPQVQLGWILVTRVISDSAKHYWKQVTHTAQRDASVIMCSPWLTVTRWVWYGRHPALRVWGYGSGGPRRRRSKVWGYGSGSDFAAAVVHGFSGDQLIYFARRATAH